MPNYYGPKIATDGLQLYLDAGNRKSYPGSGTAWRDLTGNENNGTTSGNPTFSSSDGGGIVFDGADDYVDLGNNLSANFSSQTITLLSFSKISSVVSKNTLISFNGATNFFLPGNRLTTTYQLYWDSSAGWKNGNTSTWAVDQWYYFGWTISGTSLTFYLNGVPDGIATVSSFSVSSATRLGFANSGEYCTGTVASTSIYNRALSPAEILENYSANKTRFGL